MEKYIMFLFYRSWIFGDVDLIKKEYNLWPIVQIPEDFVNLILEKQSFSMCILASNTFKVKDSLLKKLGEQFEKNSDKSIHIIITDLVGFKRFKGLIEYKFGPSFDILTSKEISDTDKIDPSYVVSVKSIPGTGKTIVLFRKIEESDWGHLGSSRIFN